MFKSVDWKFQTRATKWHQLEAFINFDRLFLIAANKDPKTLKKQLQDILKTISDIVETSLIVIEGEVWSPYDTIEVISKNKKDEKNCKSSEKNNNDQSIQINLYIPCVSISFSYKKIYPNFYIILKIILKIIFK